MAKTVKVAPLSEGAIAVFNAMKEAGRPLTLDEVKGMGIEANPSHFTALKNRGLVSAEKVEKIVVVEAKREVNVYTLVDGAEIAE
jgi:hypothetical protein